jgi:hydrogenase maturation protease
MGVGSWGLDRVLVAGIGNIFLGDDAFGSEVARRLAGRPLPPGVRVVDFGIRGLDLAFALLDEPEMAILVDATRRGGPPGTLYLIEPEPSAGPERPEGHGLDPASVLRLVGELGGQPGRVVVVGCEPATVEADADGRIGLSRPVEAAVDEAIGMIESLVATGAMEEVRRRCTSSRS